MESGSIVEYIDRQKIMCAVVLEVKNQRLRLLTENNREVNLSPKRLLHKDKIRLDLSLGRDQMVDALKQVVQKRQKLIKNIDIRDLWPVVFKELSIGVILGLVYGLLIGSVAQVRYSMEALALAVCFAVISSMSIAALVGSLVPMGFARINIDPAVATGPFVTTAIDIISVTFYFLIATALLGL